jgi:hypothetical protein
MPLQPFDNLAVNASDRGGEMLVGELRSTIPNDEITIGEWVGIGHRSSPQRGRKQQQRNWVSETWRAPCL